MFVQVTAKNVGGVFYETQSIYVYYICTEYYMHNCE